MAKMCIVAILVSVHNLHSNFAKLPTFDALQIVVRAFGAIRNRSRAPSYPLTQFAIVLGKGKLVHASDCIESTQFFGLWK